MSEPFHPPVERPEDSMPAVKPFMPRAPKRILVSFVGGTLVWVTYFNFVYALNSLTCVWGWFLTPEGTYGPGLKLTQTISTLLAVGLLGYFGYVSYREWQRDRGDGTEHWDKGSEAAIEETSESRDSLLAFVTLLLNALYLLIVLISLFPIFMLPTCTR